MLIRYGYLLGGLLAYLAAAPIAVQFLPQAGFVLVDLALALVLVAGVRSLVGFRGMFREKNVQKPKKWSKFDRFLKKTSR